MIAIARQIFQLAFRKLKRKNAIKRGRNGIVPPQETRFQSIVLFWQRKGRYYIYLASRALYLSLVVGLIIPTLLGLLFNVFIISPIQGTLSKAPIVFCILDWSTGAMAVRISYNIILMAPGRDIGRLITQAMNDGLARMNIFRLTEEIFLPVILSSLIILSFPIVAKIIDLHFGNFCLLYSQFLPLLGFDSNLIATFIIQNGALVLIVFYIVSNTISTHLSSIKDWFDHLKDDQYLVGRTLQNIE